MTGILSEKTRRVVSDSLTPDSREIPSNNCIVQRQVTESIREDAAAACEATVLNPRNIASDGRVANRHIRVTVDKDSATAISRGVIAERAVNKIRLTRVHENAAAVKREIVCERAAGDQQRTKLVNQTVALIGFNRDAVQ